MSELRLDTYTMPAAYFGPESPLPPLQRFRNASSAADGPDDSMPPDYPDKGQENNSLPYRPQDDYDRTRRPRAFKTAVLENEFLRATFLLDLGARLWSLIHKPTGRELLHVNPVFQPCNLGIRNAWFSGGVEWNVGILGHSPLTCAPLFAASVLADDGQTPILRLYEFERTRNMPFQLDCYLPKGSQVLLVRGRIVNPHDYVLPMYWWTNIAVDEKEGVRVIGPGDTALRHDYDGKLAEQDLPMLKGIDVTYSTNRKSASDLYFQIPKSRHPFIAALDGQGSGFFHATTPRLFGRKLWAWGTDPGNRHWQEYLAAPSHAYIEVQAGMAATQSQYIPMPGGAQWTWLEAYGLLHADARTVHGPWSAATACVEEQVEKITPLAWMNQELERTITTADRSPREILHHGSGWGALERRRRAKAGQKPFAPPGLVFGDDSLAKAQQPWLDLLEKGAFPPGDPAGDPGAYIVQREWHALLEESVKAGRSNHWLAWLHLGVMRWRAQDRDAAKAAWETSLRLQPSAWAMRNLAVLAKLQEDPKHCADLLIQATRAMPACKQLAIECCEAMFNVGRHRELLDLAASLPADVRTSWRVQMFCARANLELGHLDAAEQFLNQDFEPTSVREQEVSLSDVWFAFHEKRLAAQNGGVIDEALKQRVQREFPPPRRFDFRMHL